MFPSAASRATGPRAAHICAPPTVASTTASTPAHTPLLARSAEHLAAVIPMPCRRHPRGDTAVVRSPAPARRAPVDISETDWTAVLQVAVDGARMPLVDCERHEALRRMVGRVDIDLIAWRLYVAPEVVADLLNDMHPPRSS